MNEYNLTIFHVLYLDLLKEIFLKWKIFVENGDIINNNSLELLIVAGCAGCEDKTKIIIVN